MSTDDFAVLDNWKHRSQGMRCSTCMWFVRKHYEGPMSPEDVEVPFGRCRRHAPTLGGWPAVFGSDHCGDHKLDDATGCLRRVPPPFTPPKEFFIDPSKFSGTTKKPTAQTMPCPEPLEF